jgi:hypothetical protein
LLEVFPVDRGVIATANELFEGRHYPGVVAMCSDALEGEPECVPLLLIRARAHIALRRDLDAQADLRDIIRLDPQCAVAYRLLGELAARRDENESAAIFFREALRLAPGDREASDWLLVVDASVRPAAVAQKLPAPAAAAGRFPAGRFPAYEPSEVKPGRFARGTHPPEQDERPTKPFARGSERNGELWKTPSAVRMPLPAPVDPGFAVPETTMRGRPPTVEPARPAPRLATSRPMPRPQTPELPGFGDYLVTAGILTRERLRAAQAYQRSMRVQLSTAIVTLGLATPQRIEWAAVAHQSSLSQR